MSFFPLNSFAYAVEDNKIRKLCILACNSQTLHFKYICVDVTPDQEEVKVNAPFGWDYQKVSKVNKDSPRAVKEYSENELFANPWVAYYHRKKEINEEAEWTCKKMKREMMLNFDIEKDDEEENNKNE